MEMYRIFDRDPDLLLQAEHIIDQMSLTQPSLAHSRTASRIAFHRGDIAKAERLSLLWVEKEPENALAYQNLGFFYYLTRKPKLAIKAYEDAFRVANEHQDEDASISVYAAPSSYFNICAVCETVNDTERIKHWATVGLPYLERRLRLNPNDRSAQVDYTHFLFWSGEKREKIEHELRDLASYRDGRAQYNIGAMWIRLDDPHESAQAYARALDCGFAQYELMAVNMDDTPFRSYPEFEEVYQRYLSLYNARKAEVTAHG
jgi:tetratricopeptide (TPR) repeat protein